MSREQELVDICFACVLTMADHYGHFEDQEKNAAWVAEQLRSCGFDTEPMGLSWGILKQSYNAEEHVKYIM